jgi:predicted small secreted protein
MKTISIFVLFLITAFILASCNWGDGNGNGDNDDGGSDLEITWIKDSGGPIATGEYDSGILTGYSCFGYFEVDDGSGEIEITAVLEDNAGNTVESQAESFSVEKGLSYKLSLMVNCSGPSNYDPSNPPPGYPNEFTLTFTTPSSSDYNQIILQGGFYTGSLSCGQLSLETWQQSTATWSLTAKVLPEGSGTISDSLGLLVYEGTRPNRAGEFYTGEYEHGTEITFTATPATGYIFDHWYGTWWTNEPSTPSVTFSIGIPILIEAHFVAE